MHDVLDLRDLVPDEAEELRVSGFPVGDLLDRARAAAAADDLEGLVEVEAELGSLRRSGDWPYEEPTEEAELRRLCEGAPVLPVDGSALPRRIRGAWLGRAIGNTIGKPVEGLTRHQVGLYLSAAAHSPLRGYLPLLDPLPAGVETLHPSAPIATAGRFTDVPRDDDIDWTILALHVVERHGRGFSTEQLAAAWLDRLPFLQTYTAERAAYRNLITGDRPPVTAVRRNPYREWIGALIRVDLYGYLNAGRPGAAAALALTDARLSHTGNGVYGAMWAAALVASALGADSPRQALDASLAVVPAGSRLSAGLRGVLELRDSGASHTAALDHVDRELGEYSWVHTLNNAALIAIALLWGEDFLSSAGIVLQGGRDTDSNGATVGSVLGALHGDSVVPASLIQAEPLRVRSAVRDFDRIGIDELAQRTLRLAQEG
ncbi:ADP-ribosylglycohydrolase family protein [Naasia sp. SYSU D00948]|uniref:ADP-ribosylglycohydrolase family protein n=1 Tax=Naasia sp. SYSU D00948 TaxID=2817379 RepID=UPI001B30E701|nr:ADP-ribosylglycohydrolase family protein [Naasia sp. SYSU D00948]